MTFRTLIFVSYTGSFLLQQDVKSEINAMINPRTAGTEGSLIGGGDSFPFYYFRGNLLLPYYICVWITRKCFEKTVSFKK